MKLTAVPISLAEANELKKKIVWAISESSRKRKQSLLEKLSVSLPGAKISEENSSNNVPAIVIDDKNYTDYQIMSVQDSYKIKLMFSIRNHSPETILISHIYLFTASGFVATTDELENTYYFNLPSGIDNFNSVDGLSKQFKLSHDIPSLGPEVVDQLKVEIGFFEEEKIDGLFKLRIHTSSGSFYDFPFRIKTEF